MNICASVFIGGGFAVAFSDERIYAVLQSIPLCHYCKKPKNEIILTGYEGEVWAKQNGHPDGQMPMYVFLKGDIQPCDECKKIGIAVSQSWN